MSPRVGITYNMDVKVFCVLFVGLFLGLCSAVSIPSDSPPACRGYCEIFSDICKNGGTCVESAPCSNSGSCICPENYSGEHCQKLKNPGETAEQKAKPKPRVKNNLLLSLFRSLAVPNYGEKYQNNETPKPITTTSSSTAATTTTSTTTSTTTITTTTTEPTTRTTTSRKTTTWKPKESTTMTTPVTTEISSQEVTTVVSEISTTEDRLNAVSEETTTDEIPTSTELSKEVDTKQSFSDVTVGDSVLTNDALLQSSVDITTPFPTVNVDDTLPLSPSTHSITVTGGHDTVTNEKLSTEQATSERPSTNKQIDVGNPVAPYVMNQEPRKKEEAKKMEPATGELAKIARASEPQLMNEMQPLVEKNSENSDIQILLQRATKGNINEGSNSIKELDTASMSSSNEQITTPSALVTSLVEELLKTPHSKNENSKRVDKGTQTMLSMEKDAGKTVQDKDMLPAVITTSEKASPVSSSTTVQVPSSSNKDGKSDDKTDNLNKKIKNGTDTLSEKQSKLYEKIIKKITKSIKDIIKTAISESDPTTMVGSEKDDTQRNFDHIIPDTVNNVNQMDQHLNSKSNLVNNDDTNSASSALVKPINTINVHPTVEGQSLPDSQTDSAQDVPSTIGSSKQ
ncbi:location of vulva defective 1-like isoform X3 [Crassostrea angulata]|nr:location of vulva defective 1-like isoform X3 [Crassostrea angulata]XP_052690263.1 location of vulva defective 1-like isoform X3 [Crassostrea angulata]XP_052690264.1 location of vulva defective 1-like isoform X3 [Crassostrea angulata]